uniref:UPF0496 protein At2g18630 family n=1 Tax=Cajanus cajan TaxID=3821 RepID=A0A151R0E6_CAJCA|nr:UPF0496 protein At2g18630 family [Cajanus cajan]
MGGQSSKMVSVESPTTVKMGTHSLYAADLSSYEDACVKDPNLQSFDASIQEHTNRVISSLAHVTALAAALAVPIGSVGKWCNSLFKRYEKALKGQREVISSMQIGTYISLKDLDNIRVLIDKLEVVIESLLQNADFALINEDVMKFAIDEIKKKIETFSETMENLSAHADKCSRQIRRARTVVIQNIIKKP